MLIKLKYVGTSENPSKVTANSTYVVASLNYSGGSARAIVFDNNGRLYACVADVADVNEWLVDSAIACYCQSVL